MFLARPVGVTFTALWIVYWLEQAPRRRGTPSEFDRKQRSVPLSGAVVIPILILVPPWEYVTFGGPIPRDGALACAGLAIFGLGIAILAAAMRALGAAYTSISEFNQIIVLSQAAPTGSSVILVTWARYWSCSEWACR